MRGESRPRRPRRGARRGKQSMNSLRSRVSRFCVVVVCGHENDIYGSRPGLTSTRGCAPYAAVRPFAAILRMRLPISSRFFLPRPWVPSCSEGKAKGGSGQRGLGCQARGARRAGGGRRRLRGRGHANRSQSKRPRRTRATGALPAARRTGGRGGIRRATRVSRNPRNFFMPMTHLPLGELKRALVPANLKQLHEALLVGSAADDVANQLADVLHASAEFLLYERGGKMTRGQHGAHGKPRKTRMMARTERDGDAPPCAAPGEARACAWRPGAPSRDQRQSQPSCVLFGRVRSNKRVGGRVPRR